MTEPTPAGEPPSREARLERLEALLEAAPRKERALGADALQGMFTAFAIGPDEAPPAEWLDVALGRAEDNQSPAPAPAPELQALLEGFLADTIASVRDGTLALLLYSLRRGRPDYASWAQGFLLGVELSDAGWYDAADPEDVDELLFPLFVLADELTAEERAGYSPAGWRKLVLDAEAGLDQSLMRLREYWTIVRSPPETVRHAAPPPGRNDRCPCGSGRKFKQCCGR